MPAWIPGAVLLALLLDPTAAQAEDTWSEPFPGVRRLYRTTGAPNRVHALVVDLCHPGVRVQATTSSQRGRVTSSYAWLVGAQAAVNGDWFSAAENYKTAGLAIGNGARWSGTADSNWEGFVAFGPENADIVDVSKVVSSPPDWMNQVVGGRFQIVKDDVVGTSFECDWGGGPCDRHPRTAVGMSEDRRTLYLAVVDGRSSVSIGLTGKEMGTLMKGLGAHDAMMLDGGGSSTMYLRGKGVVNTPSDGGERVVANHIAVFATGTGDANHCIPDVLPEADAGPIDEPDAGAGDDAGVDQGAADGDADGGCEVAGGARSVGWLLLAPAMLILRRRRPAGTRTGR